MAVGLIFLRRELIVSKSSFPMGRVKAVYAVMGGRYGLLGRRVRDGGGEFWLCGLRMNLRGDEGGRLFMLGTLGIFGKLDKLEIVVRVLGDLTGLGTALGDFCLLKRGDF